MKSKILSLFLLLASLLAVTYPSPAHAREEASFDYFYDSLRPLGDWVQVGDYGLCWHPAGVAEDWAPYTDGYWAYTDGGWTWVSYEEFGGITYHYGRWTRVEDEGWVWVPDYEWAPAWVSFRHGGRHHHREGITVDVGLGDDEDDVVGWAPLPPEVHFQADIGVSTWVDSTYDIGPGFFHFCHVRDFGAPVIREVLIPREENVTIIRNTVNITNITVSNGQTFVGGPSFALVSARAARPIPTLKLVRETTVAGLVGGRRAIAPGFQRGNTLVVSAPLISRPSNPAALAAQFKPARVLSAPKIAHGWEMVKAPEERRALHEQLQAQVKGATPQSAPAHAVAAAEIKAVPLKADPNAKVAVTHPRGPVAAGGFTAPGTRPGAAEPATVPAPPAVAKGKKGVPPPAVTPPTVTEPTAPATPAVVKGKGRKGAAPVSPAPTATGGFVPPNKGEPLVAPRAPSTAAENSNAGKPAEDAALARQREAVLERQRAAAQEREAVTGKPAARPPVDPEALAKQREAVIARQREAAQERAGAAAKPAARPQPQADPEALERQREAVMERQHEAAQERAGAAAKPAARPQPQADPEALQRQREAVVARQREAAQERAAAAPKPAAPAAAAAGKRPLTKAEIEALKKQQQGQ